jgi:hypothetical protein
MSLISTQMLCNISNQDFPDHVCQNNSYTDVVKRCGYEFDCLGKNKHGRILKYIKAKAHNMKLNMEHFFGQNRVPDDVFKTIVRESDSLRQVMNKSKVDSKEKILHRMKELNINITHFKIRKTHTAYKRYNKMDAIDDETFKILVKNNRTWRNLALACGFKSIGGGQKLLVRRIEMLGLDMNHLDRGHIDDDKIFVMDGKRTHAQMIKNRLVRDRSYECNACKNVNFTKRDGVLMWNDQKITLQLEHINGVNNDNRHENLILLCPNCHSQTSTFCGGNSKKHKALHAWVENGKTEHPPGSITSLLN